MSIQRYQPDQDERGRTAPMNKDDGGDYVLFSDHEAAIAERCQCRFDDAKQEITTWCAHHAALRDNAEAAISSLRGDLRLNAAMLSRQCDLSRDAEAALAAETKRREEAEACPVCSGTGEKSTDGRPCACNGSGKWYETYLTLQREVSAKDKRIAELEAELDDQIEKASACSATADQAIDLFGKMQTENEKLTAENVRLREALEETHDWYCGCGHWNGPNLSNCGQCNRTPNEGRIAQAALRKEADI